MTDLETIEQLFWHKVWRCTHRHPCKKCCWPWRKCDTSFNQKSVWQDHFSCALAAGEVKISGPVHRLAYVLMNGPIPFRGRGFHICHQCHFGPCCNPSHLRPGSATDNAQDRRRVHGERKPIVLPDGRLWAYTEACQNTTVLWEAFRFQRIWAGPYPVTLEAQLFAPPTRRTWPGAWPAPKLTQLHEVSGQSLARIRQTMQTLAREEHVSLAFLCYVVMSELEKVS